MNARPKSLKFTKMHALGNDFMLINAISQTVRLTRAEIAALAHRHTGVGFDQCLIVEASTDPEYDYFYRIFNANGTEVGQCGNGARALGAFLSRAKLTTNNPIRVKTKTTSMLLNINSNGTISVDLPPPQFTPAEIPMNALQEEPIYTTTYNDDSIYFHAVNVGNPHIVIPTEEILYAPVESLGRYLSENSLFPEQTNVNFMEIINDNSIRLRVYERGVGETLACGSGAVASAICAIKYHQLKSKVKVILPGGILMVEWQDQVIRFTGDATFVYDGVIKQ